MKVIVTGGAGYIGSHTVVELIEEGFQPIIVDNLCNSDIRNIQGIKEITGVDVNWYNVDCSIEKELIEVFEKEEDIVGTIHFAAFKSVEESVREPEKYYKNNIGSLEVLLRQMKKHKVNNHAKARRFHRFYRLWHRVCCFVGECICFVKLSER